ncbi:MAG: hypothetical protein PHV49_04335 [Alistipes sp.]|nr:hypothetical protein [Alistipes sp.]
MDTTQTYRVAGHNFSVQMDATSALWNHLGNYAPFETQACDEKEKIFTLRVEDDLQTDFHTFSTLLLRKDPEAEALGLEVYKGAQGDYLFHLSLPHTDGVNARLRVSSDYRTAAVQTEGSEAAQAFAFNRTLMICYLLATAKLDTLLMHASAIVCDGKGYLFMGKSGTGKSTHSSLWIKYIEGSKLMNDDNPVIRIVHGVPILYGSPWSGKTPCYRNVSAPVGGFIRLKQGAENRIRRQNPIESYASLLSSSSGMAWEQSLSDGKDCALQHFIALVPCWLMECRPDEEAARLCADTVRKEEPCND